MMISPGRVSSKSKPRSGDNIITRYVIGLELPNHFTQRMYFMKYTSEAKGVQNNVYIVHDSDNILPCDVNKVKPI